MDVVTIKDDGKSLKMSGTVVSVRWENAGFDRNNCHAYSDKVDWKHLNQVIVASYMLEGLYMESPAVVVVDGEHVRLFIYADWIYSGYPLLKKSSAILCRKQKNKTAFSCKLRKLKIYRSLQFNDKYAIFYNKKRGWHVYQNTYKNIQRRKRYYISLVENKRIDGKVVQIIKANLDLVTEERIPYLKTAYAARKLRLVYDDD